MLLKLKEIPNFVLFAFTDRGDLYYKVDTWYFKVEHWQIALRNNWDIEKFRKYFGLDIDIANECKVKYSGRLDFVDSLKD